MYCKINTLTEVEIRNSPVPTVDGVRLSMSIRPKSLTPKINSLLGTYVALRNVTTKARDLIAKEITNELNLLEGK
jgi:hypothetical protein